MLAQIIGTVTHMPIMSAMLGLMPNDPILALGLTTSLSSFVKLLSIIAIGKCYENV